MVVEWCIGGVNVGVICCGQVVVDCQYVVCVVWVDFLWCYGVQVVEVQYLFECVVDFVVEEYLVVVYVVQGWCKEYVVVLCLFCEVFVEWVVQVYVVELWILVCCQCWIVWYFECFVLCVGEQWWQIVMGWLVQMVGGVVVFVWIVEQGQVVLFGGCELCLVLQLGVVFVGEEVE